MPWTFEQRIQRACEALLDRNMLEEPQVEHLKRPLYYGKYAYGMGLSLRINFWGDWFEIKDEIHADLQDLDCFIQSNRKVYQFNVFSSDPAVLRRIMKKFAFTLTFNHVRVVDRSCWHLKLPAPRPKEKFFGLYGWRFKFKDPMWGMVPENLEELEKLSGDYKLVLHPRSFLYLAKLSDVLIFKLVASEQLLSLDDRHLL
jgi:hypothetical protein